MNLQEDCGRLFEAGFMLGAVRALRLLPRRPPMLATYEQERALFPVHTVIERFVQHTAGAADHEAAATLARSWLLRGHLCGLTFLREYTGALFTRAGSGSFTINGTQQRLALRYWQCSLRGSNQLLEPSSKERDAERTMWLAQLGQDLACTTRADRTRGGFLNADLLLFFTHQGTGSHELLALDCSAFAGGVLSSGRALSGPEDLLDLLQAEATYHAGHGGIARAAIDATLEASGLFDAGLSPYLAAFAHSDKETYKLIQAAAYAHSALTYLERNGVLGRDERIRVTVVGYTSYGVNSMVLERGQLAILAACGTIYRQARTAAGTPAEREPAAARTRLLEVIVRSAGELFPGAGHFLATLQGAIRNGTRAEYEEHVPAFQNTAGAVSRPVLQRCALRTPGPSQPRRLSDTRSAHAALVYRALAARWRFVFLTGNPGIGKTTAVARYLMEECHDEGYVLLYASPRTLVNQDIFSRFRTAGGESFYSPQWIGLTTNRAVIEAEGTAAVYYTGAAARLPRVPAGVRYVPWPVDPQDDPPRWPMSRLVRGAEDVINDRRRGAPGVVSTLCRGIHGVLSTRETNAVVAAFSIQALRHTETGDTLKYLALIFGDAYQERLGGFLEPPMRALAATTRHVVVMIDEITGDPAGHAFLRLMAATLAAWRLEQYGFRASIVVADASLTGKDVVCKHLGLEQWEPDARKIYLTLRPARGKSRQHDPIAIESFRFTPGSPGEPDDACLITAHSFPAAALRMRYRVRAQAYEIPAGCTGGTERRALGATGKLDDTLDADIAEDVCEALATAPGEQILVFVQHKRRLQRIIDRIGEVQRSRGEPFTLEEDYLPIHADVPRRQLELLRNGAQRDRFRVFFVTSSASRGLTFPRVRHIFVEVPRFHTETNLMEIVQVIYRGRGGALDQGERTITVYVSGQILAPEGRLDEYVRDGTADLITALVLVKLAIVSRIRGGMLLQRRWISLVPVGGKSVAGSDRAFHHELAHLRRTVVQEMAGPRRHDVRLQAILAAVTALTATARIQVDRQPGSLLQVIDACTADQRRLEEWLCADDLVQPAYVCGSLLLVPIAHAATTHLITLHGTLRVALSEEARRAVRHVLRHHRDYTAAFVQGVRALRALQSTLQDAQRSQYLEHHGALRDTYYAIPMAVFTAREAIRTWCVQAAQAQDGVAATALRDALQDVLREVYPLESVLPIGPTYEDFPFLVITSQDLRAMRATLFRRGSILVSPEMNLLALILAREERPSRASRATEPNGFRSSGLSRVM